MTIVESPQSAFPRRRVTMTRLPQFLSWRWFLPLLGVALAAGVFLTPERSPLLAPLVVLTVMALVFFNVLLSRQPDGAPIFQSGGFFALILYTYAVYPSVVYLAHGMSYGPLSDGRLYLGQPTPAEIGFFEWWYVDCFASFALVYLFMTRGIRSGRWRMVPPPRGISILVVALYAGLQLFLAVVSVMYPSNIE